MGGNSIQWMEHLCPCRKRPREQDCQGTTCFPLAVGRSGRGLSGSAALGLVLLVAAGAGGCLRRLHYTLPHSEKCSLLTVGTLLLTKWGWGLESGIQIHNDNNSDNTFSASQHFW